LDKIKVFNLATDQKVGGSSPLGRTTKTPQKMLIFNKIGTVEGFFLSPSFNPAKTLKYPENTPVFPPV
jgi:hypothetical protein